MIGPVYGAVENIHYVRCFLGASHFMGENGRGVMLRNYNFILELILALVRQKGFSRE
jgi:hypothetical protein